MSNIKPFKKNGRFTDIRVILRESIDRFLNAKKGILIVFDEEEMYFVHVCSNQQMAYAAAELMVQSTKYEDED